MQISVLGASKNLKMKQIIDQLIYERAPWLATYSTTTSAVGRILKACLNYKITLEQANRLECLTGIEILNTVGDEIARQVSISGLDNVPSSGAALIVANHPTGIADAIILHNAIRHKRPDVYFFANSDILRVFPQMNTYIAPVEWRKEKRSKSQTRKTLRFTKQAMEQSRLGVIFPSGRLAKRVGIKLIEREWMTSAATMAKKYDVPVIPVHISARNSYLFYMFDLIHPTLRDITLFKETLNKKDFRFHITIGQSVEPKSLSDDPNLATSLLKSTVNALGNNYKEYGKASPKYYWKTALKTVI